MTLGVQGTGPKGAGWDSISKPGDPKKVDKPFEVEEIQHAVRNISSTTDAEAITGTQSKPTLKTDAQKAVPFETQIRPMSKSDVIDQLIQLRTLPSKENQQILLAMLEHGLSASENNFESISRLVKGKQNGSALESAIISHTKGLSNSFRSVDVLASFLANNPQLSPQVQQLRASLYSFQTTMLQNQNLLPSGLAGHMAAILTDLDTNLKKIARKTADDKITMPEMKRGEMISDLKTLYEFLGGISNLISEQDPSRIKQLMGSIHSLKGNIKEAIDKMTSHAILSKDNEQMNLLHQEKFAYWVLPNVMAQMQSDIELLIKKILHDGKTQIDPENTKIILKFKTEALGEVCVIVEIKDRKIKYTFETEIPTTRSSIAELIPSLQKAMRLHNYEITSVRTTEKRTIIKKLLIPTINLDELSRIRTEV